MVFTCTYYILFTVWFRPLTWQLVAFLLVTFVNIDFLFKIELYVLRVNECLAICASIQAGLL